MFAYGVGSVIFALGSAIMIIMWKDEQFGLSFIAVLNNLGGPKGRPFVFNDISAKPEEATKEDLHFSLVGSIFIMVYCLAATLSVYTFTISMHYLSVPGGATLTNMYI